MKYLLAVFVLVLGQDALAQPAVEGYADYAALAAQVKQLDESALVAAESLGKTLGGREIFLLTIGAGKPEQKPAILVVGNVHAPHLLGSELAMRMARQLAEQGAKDDAVKQLLERYTFYVVPRPNPDASEAFFRKPYQERVGNERSTDDDRDGERDEDPNEDLDGDGWITSLRVEDPAGTLLPHQSDEGVLVEADPRKNERGQYRLLGEGRDNDDDEQFNEDGPGGVSFNRNFPHKYPFFQSGAGPHQVSEVETRAVAEFCFTHSNIALVLSFTPEDNLMEPWKSGNDGDRIKTSILSGDTEYMNFLAEEYRTIHGGKDAPGSPKGEGSFSEWAYFHFGRWSLSARGWWIPKTAKPDEPKPPEGEKPKQPEDKTAVKTKATDEKRGAEDLSALNWFKSEGIDGFVPWKPLDHPNFPGKKVEVGGFKPFLRLNPPAKQLDPLADKHVQYLRRVCQLLPQLKLAETKVEPLGGGVFRITARVLNSGYLPTMSSMGQTTREPHPLQIKLELPEGMKLVNGSLRVQLKTLSGNGGQAEQVWLVLAGPAKTNAATVTVWSPSVGSDKKNIELK